MYNDEITFDKLPLAVTYLIEQVAELKQMVLKLQPTQSEKHVLIEIDDASRIIKKAKSTIYTLYSRSSSHYLFQSNLFTSQVFHFSIINP